jgi:hypothetical protein
MGSFPGCLGSQTEPRLEGMRVCFLLVKWTTGLHMQPHSSSSRLLRKFCTHFPGKPQLHLPVISFQCLSYPSLGPPLSCTPRLDQLVIVTRKPVQCLVLRKCTHIFIEEKINAGRKENSQRRRMRQREW